MSFFQKVTNWVTSYFLVKVTSNCNALLFEVTSPALLLMHVINKSCRFRQHALLSFWDTTNYILKPKKLSFPTWESHTAQCWLQFMPKVASFCSNPLTQSNMPLMHWSVSDSLVEVTPLFNKSLLQMVNVSNLGMVHAFLEHTYPTLHSRPDSSPVSSVVTSMCDVIGNIARQKLYRLISSMSRSIILL